MKKQAIDKKQLLLRVGSAALALLTWQLVSMVVANPLLLASPAAAALRLARLVGEADFWRTVFCSLGRVSAGFGLAFVCGVLLGLLAGKYPAAELLLRPWVTAARAVPVASFIILCLIWFSMAKLTVFVSFLIAFPVLYSNVLQGVRGADRALLEMTKVFRVPAGRRFFCVVLPAVYRPLLSACASAVGMAWKAGVAAEVIGIVDFTIGRKLYDAKVYFLNADLLAWTAVIVLLSLGMEKLVTLLLELARRGVEKL